MLGEDLVIAISIAGQVISLAILIIVLIQIRRLGKLLEKSFRAEEWLDVSMRAEKGVKTTIAVYMNNKTLDSIHCFTKIVEKKGLGLEYLV